VGLVAPTVSVEVFLAFSTVDPDGFVFLIPEDQYVTESRIQVLLADEWRTDEGYALARSYLRSHWDDAVVLSRVARELLALEDVERRDFALLSEAAQRADELTGGEDAGVLGTRALLQFELGHFDRAVELQRRVVELLGGGGEEAASPARAQLERFQAALPQE
jgi:hypothetical protein